MNSRAKALLYHQLGQLLRAGVPLPRAVEKLTTLSRGATAKVLRQIAEVLKQGGTTREAFLAAKDLGALDIAILGASDQAGRLEKGLAQAAEYHETIAASRSRLLTKIAYPIFIVHLAGLAFAVPQFVGVQANPQEGLWSLARYFGILWGVIIAAVVFSRWISQLAARNPAVDRALSVLPVIGKLRRAFALSRFSLAYDMQLEAGINVMSSLEAAAKASGSGRYVVVAHEGLPQLRAGESLSAVLAKSGSFPAPFLQAIMVGEDTGQLESELHRAAQQYREVALRRLDFIVEWFPRIALILVAAYIGWRVISTYLGMLQGLPI